MRPPLVSILVPAFNAGEWIAEAIDSAVGQTWPRKEVIVVDDGSRDDTLAIARRHASSEVKVVTQENRGAAAARNRAYSLCQGDYVQWLDADDLLGPDKVERQMEALRQGGGPRTLLSSEWGMFLYRPQHAEFVATALWCDLSPVEWLVRKMGQNLHMQTATWLVSRQLTEAAGPWNSQLLVDDDGEYFCRVLLASEGTRFVPGARVFYRMAGFGSLSHIGWSERKMVALLASMELHIGYLRSLEDSERVRAACAHYLQTWLPEFYPERPDLVERAARLAASLGGRLQVPPPLSWKYRWIEKGFGASLAKQARIVMPRCRWTMIRSWDRLLARLDGGRPADWCGARR
ncbi:MAG TPA: glycosyltransferase [Candidatus Sulfotelmatobacter sp.]|nr:glycosyltransferase [Candidatus Sulfotelmatobacter sp.]